MEKGVAGHLLAGVSVAEAELVKQEPAALQGAWEHYRRRSEAMLKAATEN
jgi:hypothetical protein